MHTGYYYDLDDSYDESDEEEVRAHLRCVAEQPPLKLDTSTEVNPSLITSYCYGQSILTSHKDLFKTLAVQADKSHMFNMVYKF